MIRRVALTIAALGTLVVLAGCNLGATVVVHPDGSGSYTVVMSVPDAPSNPGRAIYTALQRASTQADIPLTVTRYSSAGSSGAAMTFHFLSLADLNAETHRLAASGKGGIAVTVNRDATGWHFSASTSNSLITSAGANGAPGSPALGNLVNQVINIDLIAQLPGAPAENNAKSVTHTATSSTFTWVLSSSQTGTGMQASTTYVGNQANVKLATALTPVASASHSGGGSSSAWSGGMIALVAGGAVIVLGAAALGIVLLSRRRHASPAAVGAAAFDDTDTHPATDDPP